MSSIKLSSKESVETLSAIFFLLLFPGFFFYHQSVAAGLFPRFLGGFFSPICLVAVVMYMPFWRFWWNLFSSSPIYSVLLIFFLVWSASSAFITYWLYPTEYMDEALYQYLNTALIWVALVFVGAGLRFEKVWFRRVLWVSGAAIFLFLFHYVVTTGSLQYYAAQLYEVEEGVASYQGFSRSSLVIAFALFAISKSSKSQFLVSAASIFVLFVLAARSEFVAIIVCVAAFLIIRSRKEKKKMFAIIILGVFAIAISVGSYNRLESTRQANLFDLQHDSSWQARMGKNEDAFSRIKQSFFIGDFGAHFESGGKGSYAHNIMSVWDAFGLFGFASYCLLVILPLCCSLKLNFSNDCLNERTAMYFFLSLSVVVLLLASKSIYWVAPALAWGFYFNVGKAKKHQKINI
jgi:hypothetical protein